MVIIDTPLTDENFIRNLIPQKHPFVMIDKLNYFSDDKIVSGLTIKDKNLFVENDLFQAPGLIENMAQTVALHTGYKYFLENRPAPLGYIGAIKKVEILSLPKVDQELITTVNILHDIMGVTMVSAKIEHKDILLAQSEIKTVLAK
jgi:predicted hotdog family 3-hydroxylacyl-ACP dehydratase